MNSYKTNIELIEALPWLDARKVIVAISFVRKISFSLVEQRNQALERLNSIPYEAPFAIDLRFPEKGSYILETYGDWARKFQQLKSALSYKERTSELKLEKVTTIETQAQGFSDSQQAFWNATTAFYDQIMRGDGLFDRDKFEDYFNLHWYNKKYEVLKGFEIDTRETALEIPNPRTERSSVEEKKFGLVNEDLKILHSRVEDLNDQNKFLLKEFDRMSEEVKQLAKTSIPPSKWKVEEKKVVETIPPKT